MPFQCSEVVIGQADWIIRHSGFTPEYSSKYIPLDGFDGKYKIDFLANRYVGENGCYTNHSFGIYCFYMHVISLI